jgi:hypothetical protein
MTFDRRVEAALGIAAPVTPRDLTRYIPVRFPARRAATARSVTWTGAAGYPRPTSRREPGSPRRWTWPASWRSSAGAARPSS